MLQREEDGAELQGPWKGVAAWSCGSHDGRELGVRCAEAGHVRPRGRGQDPWPRIWPGAMRDRSSDIAGSRWCRGKDLLREVAIE